MKIIEFPEQTILIAKDQPEYFPFPAFEAGGDDGKIIGCWQLTFRERLKVLFTGKIWHYILTFNKPLQPQMLGVNYPFKKQI